jgi:RNA polymerase sigma factor (TIGR02999 family)
MSQVDLGGSGRVTQLLLDWHAGNDAALGALLPLVYQELRSIAGAQLRRERQPITLQRTALVHEAYLRLVDQGQADWKSRAQFFAVASQIMRRILVDHARQRSAAKRGGGLTRIDVESALSQSDDRGTGSALLDERPLVGGRPMDLSDVDAALQRLEKLDPRQGKLVELRFFGGLSIDEAADALDISRATAKRDWAFARAWLQRALAD